MSSQYFGNKNDNKKAKETKGKIKKKQLSTVRTMVKKAGRGK